MWTVNFKEHQAGKKWGIETFHNLKTALPMCDLAAFYDNTLKFRRFAIYKNGKLVRISQNVPIWYKRFTDEVL